LTFINQYFGFLLNKIDLYIKTASEPADSDTVFKIVWRQQEGKP